MITCERCNTENLDGAQYCDECGALLASGTRMHRPETSLLKPPTPSTPLSAHVGTSSRPSAFDAPQAGGGCKSKESGSRFKDSNGAHGCASSAVAEPPPASRAHAKLIINRGRSTGKEFLLSEDEMHIGRWDADRGIFPDVDLDADDPEAKVSRRHARILRRGGQYYIEDLGSTNGTFINRGRRLLPGDRQILRDNDEIIVGKTFLRFQIIK
jgi:hypothetical protein